MLNSIVIMGRLVRDPEMRKTGSDVAVCSFTVAVDRDYQKDEKITDFIDCVAWRSTAEFISRYFSKGRMIVVQGSLQSRKWQDKDGNNRVSWEVQTDKAFFGDSKPSGQSVAAEPPKADIDIEASDTEFTPVKTEDLPF